MKKTKYLGFIFGSLVALVFLSIHAKADGEWGELGYTKPGPVVEEIPESIVEDAPTLTVSDEEVVNSLEPVSQVTSVQLTQASAETSVDAQAVESKSVSNKKRATDISTVENTYGVVTEERQALSVFVSPFAGAASIFGNDSAEVTPRYAAGVTAGLLISSNILTYGSFTYSEQNVSPVYYLNSANGILGASNQYLFKQSTFEGGIKLYVLGRESRIRPFIGGGVGYSRGSLNYSNSQLVGGVSPVYLNDLTLSQINGIGEVGAEIGITRSIVANASFKLRGILSSSTSAEGSNSLNVDPGRATVGNSLSRSASYVAAAGLGIYF